MGAWGMLLMGVWGLLLTSTVSVQSAGLALDDRTPPKPSPPRAGGLTLTPTPGAGIPPVFPWEPPRPPRPPTPPPFHPPDRPTPPLPGRICDCLQWTYTPHPALTFFQILVSTTTGQYTADQVRAIIPAATPLITEYPCDELFLADGMYYAVVQAVGFDQQSWQMITSEYSEHELCLTVQHRQVYGCPEHAGQAMGQCTGDPVTSMMRSRSPQ